jgi:hypothetical protein
MSLALCVLVGAVAALAQPDLVVPNTGRCDFDALPDAAPLFWNVQNYEYPPDALSIENLGKGNKGLRIGRADGSQAGRLTITLRAFTHDWNPDVLGVTHRVSARFSAGYTGAAFLGVASPTGGTLVDIGDGRLKVRKSLGEGEAMVDLTDQVQAVLDGRWSAGELHTYALEWRAERLGEAAPCTLLIDGKAIATFPGRKWPATVDSALELSFERGAGTGLVDFVEWHVNDGRPKPVTGPKPFVVERGVRQLFLDDFGIESMDGLTRVLNQPTRYPGNPVLKGENPWEMASTSVYGTMLYEPETKLFRLWYLCTPGPREDGRKWLEVGGYRRGTGVTLLAYATSKDAIHWEKPALNQLSFEGSRANNLLDIGIDNPEGVGILRDDHDPDPARRYKAFLWDRRLTPSDDPTAVDERLAQIPVDPPWLTDAQRAGGMWVAFSPDGITWETDGPVLTQGSDTTHTILYDPKLGQYVAFGRLGFGRTVARTTSVDALAWSEPRMVLACDGKDGPGGQVYAMPTTLYEGLYMGMFWMYREGTDAKIDTQLAVSRDGIRWKRVADRATFLETGPEGAWDDGMARCGREINVVGDTLYLHYSMVNGPHRSAPFPNPVRKFPGAIGLVTLRRDGFVSLNAGGTEGSLLTKPFVLPEGDLHVNADLPGGELRVTVCDETGEPLAAYRGSEAVTGDMVDATVAWKGTELRALAGRTVRLRFSFSSGRLFSYWVQ